MPAFPQLVPNLGGQRAGISAFQFLKIGVGARGVAMGEAYVAVANDASSLFWNPAGLAQMTENQVFVQRTRSMWRISAMSISGLSYHFTGSDALGLSPHVVAYEGHGDHHRDPALGHGPVLLVRGCRNRALVCTGR
ncbi:MAG: hypothetical protein MZV64_31575 [Ignavibacteriales bacterium]|nr:hypothetical protein [Ignavibacteriales bacterium]